MVYFILAIIVAAIYFGITVSRYKKTEYYAQTKNSFLRVWFDIGIKGEYYTYKYLKSLDGYKRYLFNLYLPKENEETTELDVVLLHDSGLYVFESKNYSGWIFGTETQKNWTQTLPMGKGRSQKNQFFNPIMQNKVHIKWLKEFLQNDTLPIYSCIVFSDRCTLKNINLTSGEHAVINRYDILKTVSKNAEVQGTKLSHEQVDELYHKLYPLTQKSAAVKAAHVQAIQDKYKNPKVNPSRSETPNLANNVTKTCPKCGGKLVVRTASKGQNQGNKFWGCSNYPKCRYIEKI